MTRLALLIVTIFLSNIFSNSHGNSISGVLPFTNFEWVISIHGVIQALELSAPVVLIVVASVWVPLSSGKRDFVAALAVLRLPESVALTINAALELMSADGEPKESYL